MPVTHEEIAVLAYKLWRNRGEPLGSPEVDWERAEATLQLKAMNLVKTDLSSDLGAERSGAAQTAIDSAELSPSAQPPASLPKPEQSRVRKSKAAAPRPQPR